MKSLRKACALSPVPALLLDEAGKVIVASAAAETAFGAAAGKLGGRKLRTLIAEGSLQDFDEAMETGQAPAAAELELVFRRTDAATFPGDLTVVRIPLEVDSVVWATVHDLSDRDALAQSEAAFRALAQATNEAVVLHRSGTVVLTNDAAIQMFGVDAVGGSLFDFVAPEARAGVLAHIQSQSHDAYESVGLRADGTRFPVEARGTTVSYHGETLRVVTLRDQSEKQRMERQLAAAERLASIGRLASSVAHEINNPLAYVVLNLDLALETLAEGTNQKTLSATKDAVPALEQALEGAERIRTIVSNLRALASEPGESDASSVQAVNPASVSNDVNSDEMPESTVPPRARVLVVDDERPVRDIIGRILERSLEVLTVDSGAAAIKALEENPPFDALLCDLMMPNMGGIELLGVIAERWPELSRCCVLMSGGTTPEPAAAWPMGVEPLFLGKPFKADKLLATIAEAIEREPTQPA